MNPIRIGSVNAALSTPDNFLLVKKDADPFIRIDIYQNSSELNLYQHAVVFGKMIAIGFGHKTDFVWVDTLELIEFKIDDYFMSFLIHDDYLFVTTARSIYKFNNKAELMWKSDAIGIDGVEILKVQKEILYVRAEQSPPGEWFCYTVDNGSGKVSEKTVPEVESGSDISKDVKDN